MQRINAPDVTPYRNPVCHAVRTGNLVFLSGITPFHGDRQIAVGDFAAQMRQTLENVGRVLRAAGSDISLLVKTTVYLRNHSDFPLMNEIYGAHFPNGEYPCRTTVISSELSNRDFLVQVEGVAESR